MQRESSHNDHGQTHSRKTKRNKTVNGDKMRIRRRKKAERMEMAVQKLRCAVSHFLSANRFFDLVCRS